MNSAHELDRMVLLVRDLASEEIDYKKIVGAFQGLRVVCKADGRNLTSHAGQTALVTFVSLVARMGVQIFLDIPEIRLLGKQPPIHGSFLKGGLVELGRDLIPGSLVHEGVPKNPDLTFVFGDTPGYQFPVPSWRVAGGPWVGEIMPVQRTASPWLGSWPIGSMAAATMAAGEVFKAVASRFQSESGMLENLLTQITTSATWDFGSEYPVPEYVECGCCDFISAGAINQALLFALLRIPGFVITGRVFDDDITDRTNLNRNMLTRRSDVGRSKERVVSSYVGGSFLGISERVTENTFMRLAPLADSVLVGTDHIPSRWVVQKASQGWVGIGGTSHFGVLTSSHIPGQPCGGCLHWKDDLIAAGPIPTVSFISFWAGLSLAVRFLREKIGNGYGVKQQALWLVPLRLNEQHAAMWSPVASRHDCPVKCIASAIKSKQTLPTLS